MATQKKDTIYPNNRFSELKLRALYTDGQHSFVFGDFNKSAKMEIASENVKVKNESIIALNLEVHKNNEKKEVTVFGNKGRLGNEKQVFFEDLKIQISYGSKIKTLPFSIKLNDFIMEKYPGTNAASSYASEVTVISREKTFNQRIYMNHILDMQGYRFFQSSFDNDEKGTYLSVNHDFIGTWVSYIGYILLTIGLLMTFFSKKTRFYQLTQKIKKLRAQSGTFLVLFFLFFTAFSYSQTVIKQDLSKQIVDVNHANAFSKIVVQDHNGRMKPIHTLSREILRKLARKEQIQGYSADQILLSLFANNKAWYGVDIIKLGEHQKIRKQLNVNRNLVAYKDFFNTNGSYKLNKDIRRVRNTKPVDRGTYEKELLKIDERVNILTMVFSGAFLKIIPTADKENNTWISTQEHNHANQSNQIAIEFFTAYKNALFEAMSTNDYTYADKLIGELKIYQKKEGSAVLPSDAKIKTELFLNNLNVFNKLALYYFLLGFAFLFFLFFSIFKPNIKLKKIYIILFALVLIGFFFHTLGLGLRWYVSGRAPWSNGYESMIYIAWTSTLAGLLFTRKSFGGIAATMILASTILLVAMLSYLDPQITPLVPVLKSYWLTIHVSMEAGSYGFLLLGAIIGFINLILMIFITKNNKKRIVNIIKEMSYISELTLIGGLVMISIGTYLGGVWANESWGRYWGWDAKETWALVTILIYVFILHMRIIPKLNGLFLFNVMSIFGMASVIMTYYGVNYYLSGLHSYATGDPVPIPNWVYTVISVIVLVCVFAFIKKKKFKV
jgi:cytochrome c-type biogenesis protein CcsB